MHPTNGMASSARLARLTEIASRLSSRCRSLTPTPFHSMSTLLRRTLTAPRPRSPRAAPWLLASPFLLLFAVQGGALSRPKTIAEPSVPAFSAHDRDWLLDPAFEPEARTSGAGAAEALHRALQR